MISDLIGSTTEPVIRKRITRVATTMIAKAIGRWRARLRLEVDEVGGRAADQHGRPGRRRQRRGFASTVAWLASEMNGFVGDRLDRGDAVAAAAAAARPRRRRRRRATRAASARRRPRPAAFDRDPDRRLAVGRELGADRVVGLAGAGRLRAARSGRRC